MEVLFSLSLICLLFLFSSDLSFFSSRRRHTRYWRDWSSDVCSSDLSRTPPLPKSDAAGGSWPSFRGTQAAGFADGQNLPDRWDGKTGENILWRTPIPGLAHSSPVVWGDKIFVTTAVSSDPKATFRPGLYGDGDASADRSLAFSSSSSRYLRTNVSSSMSLAFRTATATWLASCSSTRSSWPRSASSPSGYSMLMA